MLVYMDNYCKAQIRVVDDMQGLCVLKQVYVDTAVLNEKMFEVRVRRGTFGPDTGRVPGRNYVKMDGTSQFVINEYY
jgi:hypothetical protein